MGLDLEEFDADIGGERVHLRGPDDGSGGHDRPFFDVESDPQHITQIDLTTHGLETDAAGGDVAAYTQNVPTVHRSEGDHLVSGESSVFSAIGGFLFCQRKPIPERVRVAGSVLPFGVTIVGALLVDGEPLDLALRHGVGVALVGVLCGFMTIAFSAWSIVKDAFLALLWTMGSSMLGGLLLMEAAQAGETTWIRFVIFPLDALQQLSTGSAIGEGLMTIFGQMVAFAAIAGLGLVWLDRRPLPPSSFEAGG